MLDHLSLLFPFLREAAELPFATARETFKFPASGFKTFLLPGSLFYLFYCRKSLGCDFLLLSALNFVIFHMRETAFLCFIAQLLNFLSSSSSAPATTLQHSFQPLILSRVQSKDRDSWPPRSSARPESSPTHRIKSSSNHLKLSNKLPQTN
jgi:hypothetical protein